MRSVVGIIGVIGILALGECGRCPGTDWFARRDTSSCYYIYDGYAPNPGSPGAQTATFQGASQECRIRGGYMLTLEDEAELSYVASKFPSSASNYWIGLSYASGQWQWDNGESTSAFDPARFPTMDMTLPGFVNPSLLRGTITYIPSTKKFGFEALSYSEQNGYICKASYDKRPWCKVEDGWSYDDGKCYLHVAEEHSFSGAQAFCYAKGGVISAVNTEREDLRMKTWLRDDLRVQRAWLGVKILNKNESTTIDDVKWEDGERLNNSMVDHWDLGGRKTLAQYIRELINGRDYCGEMRSAPEEWWAGLIQISEERHDWSFQPSCITSRYPFACESPLNKCPYGWHEQGDKCYKFYEQPEDWKTAGVVCERAGSHLVSVKDKELQDFLRTIIWIQMPWLHSWQQDKVSNFWLGGMNSKEDTPKAFKWLDNTPVTYSNWSTGVTPEVPLIPNPGSGVLQRQDYCIFMDGMASWDKGNWNVSVCTSRMGFVCGGNAAEIQDLDEEVLMGVTCEAPYQRYHDGCYAFVSDKKTRDAAQEHCATSGGFLFTPYSFGENHYVLGSIASDAWLGLKAWKASDESRQYIVRYGDDSVFDRTTGAYENFYDWPEFLLDEKDLCTIMVSNSSHHNFVTPGGWRKASCLEERNFVCYHDGTPSSATPPPNDDFDPECGAGWMRDGDQCYKINIDETTWDLAKQNCQGFGPHADLLSIVTKEEESFIQMLISGGFGNGFIGPLPAGYARSHAYWLNFYTETESGWYWPHRGSKDRHLIPLTVFNWRDGQPNYGNEEDLLWDPVSEDNPRCAYIAESGDARWIASDCRENKAYICKKPTLQTQITSPAPTPSSGFGCPDSYFPWIGKCLKFVSTKYSWTDAREHCQSDGGDLVSFSDSAQFTALHMVLRDAWVGLNSIEDYKHPRVYVWSDGTPVTYTPWDHDPEHDDIVGTGHNYMDCVSASGTGINGFDCDYEYRASVCSTKVRQIGTPATAVSVPQGQGCMPWGFREGSSCFYFGNNPAAYGGMRSVHNFADARAFCQSTFSGDLATVKSTQELNFLKVMIGTFGGDYWIGLKEDANSWNAFKKWVDGTAVLHTNWAYGQPTIGVDGAKGCIAMLGSYSNGQYPGDWFVGQCEEQKFALCKAPAAGFTNPPVSTSPAPLATGCPKGWITEGESTRCFKGYSPNGFIAIGGTGANKANWHDAETFCQGFRSGHLASINSQAEQNLVTRSLPLLASGYSYWIGLRESATLTGERWSWSDGTPYTTNFVNFHPTENHETSQEDCAALQSMNGNWVPQSCKNFWGWVCEVPKGAYYANEEIPPYPTPMPTNHTCGRDTTGRGDWYFVASTNECVFFSKITASWENAQTECFLRRSHLAIITSQNNQEMSELVSHNHGGIGATTTWQYYIGLRKADQFLGEFRWVDDSPLLFANWETGQPSTHRNDTDQCVLIHPSYGKWIESGCSQSRHFICTKRNQDYRPWGPRPTRDPSVGGCKEGWVEYASHCYHITGDKKTHSWGDALEACKDEKGMQNASLVSIMHSAENDFLVTLLKGRVNDVWIGLHEVSSNVFEWADGHSYHYNNWHFGYPRYSVGLECISMLRESNKVGRWTDQTCSTPLGFICKAPKDPALAPPSPSPEKTCNGTGFTRYGDACFRIVPFSHDDRVRSWSHAQEVCRQFPNSDLATVRDIYENAFIRILLNGAAFGHRRNESHPDWQAKAWIGMREVYGHYQWYNNCPTQFANLESMVGSVDESACVDINNEGKWHPHNCTGHDVRFVVCEERFSTCSGSVPSDSFVCPQNFPSKCANHCYNISSVVQHLNTSHKISFSQARQRCVDMGGDLASVRTAEEHGCLHSYVQYSEIGMWIGLQNTATTTNVQTWQWVDNDNNTEPAVFANWMPGEPNYGNTEKCTEMYPNGYWNNVRCDTGTTRGYICQSARTEALPVTVPTSPPTYPSGFTLTTPPTTSPYSPTDPNFPGTTQRPTLPVDYTGTTQGTTPPVVRPSEHPEGAKQEQKPASSDEGGLSGGQTAGIVIGVLLVAAIAGAVGYVVLTGKGPVVMSYVRRTTVSARDKSVRFVPKKYRKDRTNSDREVVLGGDAVDNPNYNTQSYT